MEDAMAARLVVEQKAWGAYRTDFYPTYDYKAVAEQERKKSAK